MSEFFALARLSASRHGRLIRYSIIYYVALHCAAMVFGTSLGRTDGASSAVSETIWIYSCVFSLPLYVFAFIVFDFGVANDLDGNQTGYSHWLLRVPVSSWRLAAVPVTLKTLWVFAVTGGVALTGGVLGHRLHDWFLMSLGLSSVIVAFCFVIWQPYRWVYSRVLILAIGMLPGYLWLMTWMGYGFAGIPKDSAEWRQMEAWPLGVDGTAITVGSGVFITLVALSLRAVVLARANAFGRTPESALPWAELLNPREGNEEIARPFSAASLQSSREQSKSDSIAGRSLSPTHSVGGILNYELAKFRSVVGLAMLIGWLGLLGLFGIADNVGLEAYFFAFILFLFPSMFFCEWSRSTMDREGLPTLIAVAPLRSATIGWTKQVVMTLIWLGSLSGALLVSIVWFLRGGTEHAAATMNQFADFHFGDRDGGTGIGIVFALVATMMVIRQTTWSSAMASAGQKRLMAYSVAAKFLVAFGILSVFIYHFMQFPDWEAWSRWISDVVASYRIPLLVLCVAKLILLTLAAVKADASRLLRRWELIALLGGYVICSIAVGTALWSLIPTTALPWFHAVAIAGLLVPCTRIILAPLCVASYRHR